MSVITQKRWLSGRVIAGRGLAKTLGYPTVNLDNPEIMKSKKQGVYLCKLNFDNKYYFGLLYYGPRLVLGEEHNILEIYIIGFLKDIYGKTIKFHLIKYIRSIMNFDNTLDLKKQIKLDFELALKLIKYK